MRLYVIAGHGQGDPGCTAHGYQEAERVRALAAKLVEYGGSEVGLYPTGKDLYQQGGPVNLGVGLSTPCIELHMDGVDDQSAHGGHVIIDDSLSPDKQDKALAEYISGMFPGRAETIVKRNNLLNVNVAANVGQNYRLLEVCFISNWDDLDKFNNNIDEVARGILACFGIETEEDMSIANEQLSRTDDAGGLGPDSGVDMYGRVVAIDGYAGKAAEQLTRTDDPTGRGQQANMYDRLAWMAAKQEKMMERQEEIDGKLDRLLAMMEEADVKAEATD